ncbi:unnamed protein product, partial [Ilex paraguariensis]
MKMFKDNELLKVIRETPSEISEVVSRCRKDFTEEFFAHLHTVAESYYDNPEEQEQNDDASLFKCAAPNYSKLLVNR